MASAWRKVYVICSSKTHVLLGLGDWFRVKHSDEKVRVGVTIGPQVPDELTTVNICPDNILAEYSEALINGTQLGSLR